MLHKLLLLILICLLAFGTAYCYYFYRWRHLWTVVGPIDSYSVPHVQDDTLRVLLIGDSWAGIHSKLQMDAFLSYTLESKTSRPVSVVSRGKGGEKCKGIYRLIFSTEEYGTKSLFQTGVDYCVVFAGINDAAANLGTKQFCAYYRMIIDFLLANNIRPVIVEIPDVDIWTIYGDKSIKDLVADYVKSIMTGCGMYHFCEYREALYSMLVNENLLNKVIYVPMTSWNGVGSKINQLLFTADKIHLNHNGYEKLDECIASAISADLNKMFSFDYVNQPMDKNTQ